MMNSNFCADAVTVGHQCLQQMNALKHELELAMDAIARNSLAEFEGSLWQQEMLSSNMHRSLVLLRSLPVDPALLTRVREAGASLQQTGRSYLRLIEQSCQCAAVLHDLCCLYQHAPLHTVPPIQQALSCEA